MLKKVNLIYCIVNLEYIINFVFQSAFIMENKNPIEDLKEIRKMMESSSKFLSLSGLSGIVAGISALIGAYLAYGQIQQMY